MRIAHWLSISNAFDGTKPRRHNWFLLPEEDYLKSCKTLRFNPDALLKNKHLKIPEKIAPVSKNGNIQLVNQEMWRERSKKILNALSQCKAASFLM